MAECVEQYPTDAVLRLSAQMLAVMERVIAGEVIDEALYVKIFGNKEGMVQQLQRVCDVLGDVRAMEVQQRANKDAPVMDEEERALIRHYVVQMAKQYAQEDARASNADDALPE